MRTFIAALALLVPSSAFAYTGGSANLCQIAYAGNQSNIFHDDLGAGNYASTPQTFMCPIPWGTNGGSAGFNEAFMLVADRSSTSQLGCWVYATQESGYQYWSASRWSCSSADGCPDPTTSFVGTGRIRWNATQLGATNDYPYNFVGVGFGCVMPPGNASYANTSFVTGYMLL
jgi:hypothetical protein